MSKNFSEENYKSKMKVMEIGDLSLFLAIIMTEALDVKLVCSVL